MKKNEFKKEGEELQAYLRFKRKGYSVPAKKGKGCPYKRKNRKNNFENY